MIVIIVVFVVCQTPAFVNQLLYVLIGADDYWCGKVSDALINRHLRSHRAVHTELNAAAPLCGLDYNSTQLNEHLWTQVSTSIYL